jgi:rhodanese-related sulfurtransferase
MKKVQHVILVVGLAVAAFVFFRPAGGSAAELADARALVQNGALLLDVRTPAEFASGHVPGAVNVPVQELESKWASLKVPADRPVVVYCRSGARSARAKAWLEAHGVQRVVDIGPMPDWK